MENVTDEWIYYMINDLRIGGSLEAALNELLELRKRSHGITYALPCVNVKEKTLKEWLQKVNEELDEFKESVMNCFCLDKMDIYPMVLVDGDLYKRYEDIGYNDEDKRKIADEAMDTITAITSMLEYMGIGEKERQEAQMRVNKRNAERGRL